MPSVSFWLRRPPSAARVFEGAKLGVRRPRLREKSGGEVAIPAYQAMQDAGLGRRMLDVLLRGISTRQYAEVLPEMASTGGVSKSNVSREAAEAGEEALQDLLERRFLKNRLLEHYKIPRLSLFYL